MRPSELLSRLDTLVSELDHEPDERALAPEAAGLAGQLGDIVDHWAEAREADEDSRQRACSLCQALAAATWTDRLPKAADPITGSRPRVPAERRWCACPECGTAYQYDRHEAGDVETLLRASDLGTALAVQLRHLSRTANAGLAPHIVRNLRALRVLLAGPPPEPVKKKSRSPRARAVTGRTP